MSVDKFKAHFFKMSGKSEADILGEAKSIMALSQKNPTFERGQKLMDMCNHLEQGVIGPAHIDKSKHSTERQLLEEPRKAWSMQQACWTFSDKFTIEELTEWLRLHYAIEFYAKNCHLGSEYLRIIGGQTEKDPTEQ